MRATRRTVLGLGAWLLALGLAFAGQVLVLQRRPFDEARPLFFAALLVAAVAGWAIGAGLPRAAPSAAPPDARVVAGVRSSRRRALVVLAGGVALILASVALTAARLYPEATAAWLVGIGLVILGAAFGDAQRVRWPRLSIDRTHLLAGLALVVLALALRAVDLTSFPAEVHGDEAAIGIAARRLLSGADRNLFGLGWYEIPNMSFAVSAMVMYVLGDNLFGLRMASAIQGTLSVLLTYLVVRRLFATRPALVAAALLAGTEMHLHYSRSGFSYMQAGLATVLLVYLMLRALEHRRLLDYVLLGLVGGLCLQVYAAARLAPVLVLVYLAASFVRDRGFLKPHLRGLAVAGVTGLLFVAPMAVVYSARPGEFNLRLNEISILQPRGLNHELAAYGVSSLGEVLAIQTQKTLEAFNFSGETSLQYGRPAPLLDFWNGALFVVGIGAFAFRVLHPTYLLLSAWLWLTLLLGSVLTVDAPFSPHLTGMLPLLGIYSALYVETGWRAAESVFGRAVRFAAIPLVTAIVVTSGIANVRDYVEVHSTRLQPASLHTLMSAFISRVNDGYRVYFVSRPALSLSYETSRFLVPNLDGEDLGDGPLVVLLDPPDGKAQAFIVDAHMPQFDERMSQLRSLYPDGQEELHYSTRGELLFATYLT